MNFFPRTPSKMVSFLCPYKHGSFYLIMTLYLVYFFAFCINDDDELTLVVMLDFYRCV